MVSTSLAVITLRGAALEGQGRVASEPLGCLRKAHFAGSHLSPLVKGAAEVVPSLMHMIPVTCPGDCPPRWELYSRTWTGSQWDPTAGDQPLPKLRPAALPPRPCSSIPSPLHPRTTHGGQAPRDRVPHQKQQQSPVSLAALLQGVCGAPCCPAGQSGRSPLTLALSGWRAACPWWWRAPASGPPSASSGQRDSPGTQAPLGLVRAMTEARHSKPGATLARAYPAGRRGFLDIRTAGAGA